MSNEPNEYVELNEVRKVKKVKPKMNRSRFNDICLWIFFGGLILSYILMFFMGDPFSPEKGVLIKGTSGLIFLGLCVLTYLNRDALWFGKNWDNKNKWFAWSILTLFINCLITVGMYLLNKYVGVYLFYVVLGIGLGTLVLGLEYFRVGKMRSIVHRKTHDDVTEEEEYEEEEVSQPAPKKTKKASE